MRRRITEHRPLNPSVHHEDEMAECLDEGPLALDALVEQLGRQPSGPLDRGRLRPLDHGPRLSESLGIRRVKLGPLGVAAVELGFDQRSHADLVDPQVVNFAVMSRSTSRAPRILAPVRSTLWNRAPLRSTTSKREPCRSSWVKSAIHPACHHGTYSWTRDVDRPGLKGVTTWPN